METPQENMIQSMIIISWYLLFHDNMRISIFISECLVSRKNREKVKRWKWALLGFPRPSYSLPPWSLLIVHHHNLNQNHHHHDHHDHHDHHQGWTPTVESRSSSVNISSILNNFQVGYDRRVRPNYGEVVITKGEQEQFPGGIPVTVGVTMFILSIGDLSEKFMDFTFDMYFRQVDIVHNVAFI